LLLIGSIGDDVVEAGMEVGDVVEVDDGRVDSDPLPGDRLQGLLDAAYPRYVNARICVQAAARFNLERDLFGFDAAASAAFGKTPRNGMGTSFAAAADGTLPFRHPRRSAGVGPTGKPSPACGLRVRIAAELVTKGADLGSEAGADLTPNLGVE